MPGLVLVGMTLVVGAGGAAVAARLAAPGLVDRITTLMICALAELVAVLLVLGAADELRPWPVAGVEIGASVLLVVGLGAAATGRFVVGLGADLMAVVGRWRVLVRHPWLALLALTAAVELAWHVLIALALPVTGFDALEYHLTTVGWWLQHAGFTPNLLDKFSAGYPASTELVFAHVAMFTHNAHAVDLTQIGFAGLGALATAGLARAFGAIRVYAAGAGLLFFVTPIVLAQSRVAYVDVAAAAELAACLLCLCRALILGRAGDGRRALGAVAVSGLAAGLCIGAKPTGLPWVVAVIAALVVGVTLLWRRAVAAVAAVGVFLLTTVGLGGYWYIRDWVKYHNPVYPQALHVLGVAVFHGEALIDPAPKYRHFPLNVLWSWVYDALPFAKVHAVAIDQRQGGLGPAFVYLLLPLAVVFVVQAVRRRHDGDASTWLVIAAVVIGVLLSPYAWWSRFTMQLVVLGAALAALTFTRLGRWRLGSLPGAPALATLMTLAALAGAALVTKSTDVSPSAVGALSVRQVLHEARHPVLGEFLDAGGAGVADGAPAGSVVAEDPANVIFSFAPFGAHFERRVVAVDLRSPGVLGRLAAAGARYVFVAPPLYLQQPVTLPPTGFSLVLAADGYRLYRVTGT